MAVDGRTKVSAEAIIDLVNKGMGVAQIARVTGLTKGAVSRRLKRMRLQSTVAKKKELEKLKRAKKKKAAAGRKRKGQTDELIKGQKEIEKAKVEAKALTAEVIASTDADVDGTDIGATYKKSMRNLDNLFDELLHQSLVCEPIEFSGILANILKVNSEMRQTATSYFGIVKDSKLMATEERFKKVIEAVLEATDDIPEPYREKFIKRLYSIGRDFERSERASPQI
jgi:hypothetical protein